MHAASAHQSTAERNALSGIVIAADDEQIAARLRELKKMEETVFLKHLDMMASNALQDMCTASNPRRPSHEDICSLLRRVW